MAHRARLDCDPTAGEYLCSLVRFFGGRNQRFWLLQSSESLANGKKKKKKKQRERESVYVCERGAERMRNAPAQRPVEPMNE